MTQGNANFRAQLGSDAAVKQAFCRAGLVVLLGAAGCGKAPGREGVSSVGVGSVGLTTGVGAGTQPMEVSGAVSGSTSRPPPYPLTSPYYPWPPKYLYEFSGLDSLDALTGFAVDDTYVFWFENSYLYRKRLDAPVESTPEKFFGCGQVCDAGEIEADGKYIYSLAGGSIYRIDRNTGERASDIELWAGHGNTGGMAMDKQYLYTAIGGCLAVSRYDKQTQQQVGAVLYPGNENYQHKDAGHTILKPLPGGGILCASPDNPIFVWDSWDSTVRRLDAEAPMRGVDVAAGVAYRAVRPFEDGENQLLVLPLDGAATETYRYPRDVSWEILALPDEDLLLLPNIDGFNRFDTKTRTFLSPFKALRAYAIRRVGDDVFATGGVSKWNPYTGASDSAYVMLRIPVKDLVER